MRALKHGEHLQNDGQRHQADDSASCHKCRHLHWTEEFCHEGHQEGDGAPGDDVGAAAEEMGQSERKVLNLAEGMETLTKPSSWRWFHLMDLAMARTASILQRETESC
ncbi:kinesin-related protein 12-like protein [Lates japonicus]|uniref:Kinesin-related protein 12-like protein n=1 Tax=Lates japonicus TaxID=270547 RepID=A0AAD3MYZ1_LATJO|nr:kinesin-related protein 12-like protein [Lates japonicus]